MNDNGEKNLKAAVFLDRDGTINVDRGYISNPDDLVLIDGAAGAIKALNDTNVKVVIITNQSGVARGYYTHDEVDAVNRRLKELLAGQEARYDGLYYCPHHPDQSCGCRKPETGLVEKAAREHGIDPRLSYVVGDKATDVELAHNIGAKGVLVMTGMGREQLSSCNPAFAAADLREAVKWITADLKREQTNRGL